MQNMATEPKITDETKNRLYFFCIKNGMEKSPPRSILKEQPIQNLQRYQ